MNKIKNCHCCNVSTFQKLVDFDDIGWSAFRAGRKTYHFCEKCHNNNIKTMFEKLSGKNAGNTPSKV